MPCSGCQSTDASRRLGRACLGKGPIPPPSPTAKRPQRAAGPGSAKEPAPGPRRGFAQRRDLFPLPSRSLERRGPQGGRPRGDTASTAHLGPSDRSMDPEPDLRPGLGTVPASAPTEAPPPCRPLAASDTVPRPFRMGQQTLPTPPSCRLVV